MLAEAKLIHHRHTLGRRVSPYTWRSGVPWVTEDIVKRFTNILGLRWFDGGSSVLSRSTNRGRFDRPRGSVVGICRQPFRRGLFLCATHLEKMPLVPDQGETNVLARFGAISTYMNDKLEAAGGNDSPVCYRNCLTVPINDILDCMEKKNTYATSESCEKNAANKMSTCDPKCQ